ncbi:hypothetical protein [Demequina iriomotensis]|uniref:hypothetical protein n=1 Tax=Demequina iriomotensis TaxID=1536641 RepID=UPI000780D1E6|nr:hypothetical protein [Demequina iriomotensis]
MSSELEKAMARRAEAAHAEYGARADAMMSTAARKVSRARTMRTVGTAGLAALVVGAVATVAVATGGSAPVAPASSSPTATASVAAPAHGAAATAEQLLSESTVEQRDAAQMAWLCTPLPERRCDQLWIGDAPLVEIDPAPTTVELVEDGAAADVRWGVANVSDADLMIVPWAVLPLIEPTVDVEETAAAALADLAVMGEAHSTVLAAGATESGTTQVGLGAGSAVEPGTRVGLRALVRVPFADASDARELWLLADAGDGAVAAFRIDATSSVDALTSDDLRATAVARHREDFDRGSAQAGVDCALEDRANPRTDPQAQEAIDPFCTAVWLTDDAPLVSLADVTFAVDEAHDNLTVRWTAKNAGELPLQLDTGGTTLVFEWPADTEPLNDGGIVYGSDGTVFANSIWTSATSRHAVVRAESEVATVMPGMLISGERVVPLSEIAELGRLRFSVQIRVAAVDDATGDRELFLDIPWNGEIPTSG